MANWYYYSKTGEKVGPVSATSLKELARQGLITKETKVENQNGRTAVAGQINGLTFTETKLPETPVYDLDDGFNFPDLTSEGNTPTDYDPFANAAYATPQVLPPAQSPSVFTKPVVLAPISATCGMLLMLMIVLAFTTISGGTDQTPREKHQDKNEQDEQVHEAAPKASLERKKSVQASKVSGIALKTPHEKTAFIQTATKGIEQLVKNEFKPAVYGDHLIAPYIRVMESSWDTTNIVYSILTKVKDEKELLTIMEELQNSYDICMTNIAVQWEYGIQNSTHVFNDGIAILQTTGLYEANYCSHNLEQVMAVVTARIKTLDKSKYANTIKLYSILSKYKKAVTTPSGSWKNYSDNRAVYREEFTEAMSLAELEW